MKYYIIPDRFTRTSFPEIKELTEIELKDELDINEIPEFDEDGAVIIGSEIVFKTFILAKIHLLKDILDEHKRIILYINNMKVSKLND